MQPGKSALFQTTLLSRRRRFLRKRKRKGERRRVREEHSLRNEQTRFAPAPSVTLPAAPVGPVSWPMHSELRCSRLIRFESTRLAIRRRALFLFCAGCATLRGYQAATTRRNSDLRRKRTRSRSVTTLGVTHSSSRDLVPWRRRLRMHEGFATEILPR